MPNHVLNEVVIHYADEAERAAIVAVVAPDVSRIDFNLLLPRPLNIWWGDVSAKHRQAFREPALDWCAANWGTKWNAYAPMSIHAGSGKLTLYFTTAWAPPLRWILALFNWFSTPIDYAYLDEGMSKACSGSFVMTESNGPEWTEADADDETDRRLKSLRDEE